MKERRHLFFWPVFAIGVALIVIPFALSMPSKAYAGQTMLDNVRPMMRAANVAKTADDYYDTFVKPILVAHAGQARAAEAPRPAALSAQRGNASLALAIVVAALDQSKPLIDAMQANGTNFQKLDSLPNLRLLAWIIFVIPGILLVLFAGFPLATGLFKRRASRIA
jgi:hypothetical protein